MTKTKKDINPVLLNDLNYLLATAPSHTPFVVVPPVIYYDTLLWAVTDAYQSPYKKPLFLLNFLTVLAFVATLAGCVYFVYGCPTCVLTDEKQVLWVLLVPLTLLIFHILFATLDARVRERQLTQNKSYFRVEGSDHLIRRDFLKKVISHAYAL